MIPAGLRVAGIGPQMKMSSMMAATMPYVQPGWSRRKGAIARASAAGRRAGPANQAAAMSGMPTITNAPAISESIAVAIESTAGGRAGSLRL